MEQGLFLQSVVIHKPISLDDAKALSQKIIKNKRKTFYRETEDSYRFRNIPKTDFIIDSFVSKKINDKITIVLGKLRE